MRDYYEVLGIARNASPQIVKFAFEGKMKALADPGYAASPEVKREEERCLREAFVTLSVAAKRGPYDAKLVAFENRDVASDGSRLKPAVVVTCLVLAASALWVTHSRGKESIRIEEERLAMEKENAKRRADLDEERIRDQRARNDAAIERDRERNEQIRMQRERADYDRWRSTEESRARQSEATRLSQESRAKIEKQRDEEQLRRAEEERRRAAQREVDRQKEYLRRQELEEERARAARHDRAQREVREREYRQNMEEQRRRLQQR